MYSLRAIAPVLVLGLGSATAYGADLSHYRGFRLGADVASTAKQAGISPAEVKDVHRRPALIQAMRWRPQERGRTSGGESVQDVLFTFYDGQLMRIVVSYERSETEGLTTDDLIEATAAAYGPAERIAVAAKTGPGHYGEQEDVVARWQDADYRFELVRSSYGPSFRLIGVVRKVEEPMRAATIEALRLDEQEAPAREAARSAGAEQDAKTRLEKARLANKPKFRP